MAVFINTNVSSLGAQRSLMINTNSQGVHYERMASGLRINAADDDAANLHISNRLTTQINGFNQGNRNANDGIALAQTVEGALAETTDILQRIRTLAVQAANGTNSQDDRDTIQKEVNSLCEEINRIAVKTTFSGAQVLDGVKGANDNGLNLLKDDGTLEFQVGANANTTISVDLSSSFKLSAIFAAKDLNVSLVDGNDGNNWSDAVNGSGLVVTAAADGTRGNVRFSLSTFDLAQATLAHIDNAINYVDSKRAELGSVASRMESTIRNQSGISENTSDTRARIRDTDFAAETADLTSTNIVQQASQSVLAQANQRPQWVVQLLQ